jgi:hypothetical protein
MSALRRIKKVEDGYEVSVSCTNKATKIAVFSNYEDAHAFADEYLEKNYFGVSLNNIHHPEGDGIEPEGLNPDSLETIEIEIPRTPEQILRNLDNGYVMNRAEQAEAAQYIRQLQQENLTLLGKTECNVHECRRKVREADDDSSFAGAIIYRR